MKKSLLKTMALAICCLALKAQAQNVPINFETGGNGATWAWSSFENGANAPVGIVANPSTMGANSSATCLTMTTLVAGQPYAGFESGHPGSPVPMASNLGAFTLSTSNCIVKIMVYKSVISDVGIKFANATNGSTGEIKVANTLINQWEELTFDFSPKIGEPTSTNIDQIIFFLDFQSRTSDNVCYLDNISFNPVAATSAPMVAAPTPTDLPANVKSLFSNAYTNLPIDTWRTSWSNATLTDLQLPNTVGGMATNDTKRYSLLDFVGVEATGANSIDATTMTKFNMNVWTPNANPFRVKLVDFGADNAFGGGDDKEHELAFTPTLSGWNTYNIPMADFTNLTTKAHISQIIFSALPTSTADVYIDNVFFSNTPIVVPTSPLLAAPTPTALPANVKSLFSNAYTNLPIDTWRTSWSNATLTDLQLPNTAGGAVVNDTKRYSLLDFVGVEAVGANSIDATTMTKFNMDVWTPNANPFRVKLVDFGADNSYGGGDDKEHELAFTPTLSGWNTYNIPMADFTNLTTTSHISQIIFSALPTASADVYLDNIYFSSTPIVIPTAPMVAAPTPTAMASSVISLFSNAYPNETVDTWRTSWSNATLTDLQLPNTAGGAVVNDTKRYSLLDFVGVEATGANSIDATTMTKFNIDVWTPNANPFRVKLVDFGADNSYGGGDDKEHELAFTPTLSGWKTLNIPLAELSGLSTKSHISQIIFSALPTGTADVYIDNVYFSVDPPLVPMVAAPTPTALPADVVSLFSNAYTDETVDTWRTSWSNATLTDLQLPNTVGGAVVNDTKRYSLLDFVGIEATGANSIDASMMTKFNMDVWTPNANPFRVKLVDFGADNSYGGGDDKEHELAFTPTLSGWNTFNIPLADFVGLSTKSHISQIIFSALPTATADVYLDNVYFSREPLVAPMIAAPTPTAPAAEVLSMFSNAYTNVGVDTWLTSWSSALLTDMLMPNTVGGVAVNDTKRYSALDFVGIEATDANTMNVSDMLDFNIDIWTPNATTVKIKLVDFGADGGYGGVDDVEHEVSVSPTLGGWNTLKIPMASFTGLITRNNIAQLILSASPTGTADIYIDNVYFSKNAPLSINTNSLKGTLQNEGVLLQWTSIDEANTKNYVVEKSNNLKDFTPIETINARGSNENYTTIDATTNIGTKVYYRIKEVLINGVFIYSNIATIVLPQSTVQFVPNPATNYINIITNSDKPKTVSIYNALGKLVNTFAINGYSQVVDISNYASGTYFVKMQNNVVLQFAKQ